MKNRSYFGYLTLLCGLLMILLGVFTFVRPDGTATKMVMLYAVVALITGVCDIIFFVRSERYTGFSAIIALVCGVLSVMSGATLLVYPDAGHWVLDLLFPIWFIAHCVFRLANLSTVRQHAGKASWFFSLLINLLGIGFGLLMLIDPAVSVVSAEMIAGFYLIVMGVDSVAIAMSKVGSK